MNEFCENFVYCFSYFYIFVVVSVILQRPLNDTDLSDTVLLIKCLIVMCRHFDNISTIANYEYISSTVSIAINIIIAVSHNKINIQTNKPAFKFLCHFACFFFSDIQR